MMGGRCAVWLSDGQIKRTKKAKQQNLGSNILVVTSGGLINTRIRYSGSADEA